jgi:hypothetical protein
MTFINEILTYENDGLRKLNSITKYPSILTYHNLGQRGSLVNSLVEDKHFDKHRSIYITEKIDGTSSTYVLVNHAKPGHNPKYEFIVSSRNVRQLDPDQVCYHDVNVYWEMAEKYDLENRMKLILASLPYSHFVVLQGETFGANLQGNKYKMQDRDIRFFNIIDDHNGKWDTTIAAKYIEQIGLKWVPIINDNYILPDTVDELLTAATGPSTINPDVLREGWVLRRDTGNSIISFKAVSPEFLIKNKE